MVKEKYNNEGTGFTLILRPNTTNENCSDFVPWKNGKKNSSGPFSFHFILSQA